MSFEHIDLADPRLSNSDRRLIKALVLKRTIYLSQGRGREAHAIVAALRIVWEALMSPDIDVTLPDSVMGEL